MRQLDTYWDGEHSWQSTDRTNEKNENPPHWPFRNWLILNGQWDGIFIFFFFGPVDCTKCSRGWGGGDPGVIGPRRKSRSKNPIFCLYSILLYRVVYTRIKINLNLSFYFVDSAVLLVPRTLCNQFWKSLFKIKERVSSCLVWIELLYSLYSYVLPQGDLSP